ncbi:MAG: SAM-dependent methyltransferase [Deltaproteobacteria bacterium]|nr:SAM-dependent methyltransferase [Deltaproteobacteria bacterium]
MSGDAPAPAGPPASWSSSSPSAALPTRAVVVDDALQWLRAQDASSLSGCSFVSSIPDVSETGMSFPAWLSWFAATAALLVERTPEDGLLVLTQTDIRRDGRWVDKSFLVLQAALSAGATLLSRKVICRRPVGHTSSARAAYTHLLVLSRGLLLAPARPEVVPDVIADGGPVTWTRGLGLHASFACIDVVTRYTASRTVVDPFCGEGMVLACANARGLHALGVEKNGKRAERARRLRIEGGVARKG